MPTKGKLMDTPKELFTEIKRITKMDLDVDERNEAIYDEINCFIKRYPEHTKYIENYLKKTNNN
jgi:hypothetical protein